MKTWIFTVVAVAALVGGCRSGAVPDDFNLHLSESGGVTGWTSGFRLGPDGGVTRYQTRLDGETTETELGSIPATQRQAIWEQLTTSGLLDHTSDVAGNLTRFVEVNANGQTHRTRWAAHGSDANPLDDFYRYCVEALNADHK